MSSVSKMKDFNQLLAETYYNNTAAAAVAAAAKSLQSCPILCDP